MQDLEASDGVASTGTNATNTTNTATRMGRSVSNQLRFTQQNRITRRAFAQLKAKFRSRQGVALYATSREHLEPPGPTQPIMTIGYSLEWENRCLYARLGCKPVPGRRAGGWVRPAGDCDSDCGRAHLGHSGLVGHHLRTEPVSWTGRRPLRNNRQRTNPSPVRLNSAAEHPSDRRQRGPVLSPPHGRLSVRLSASSTRGVVHRGTICTASLAEAVTF